VQIDPTADEVEGTDVAQNVDNIVEDTVEDNRDLEV
jgi:hypothetical protein